jgi:hypothetical protein
MKIALNNARLAFPVLFKAEQFNGTGEAAYSASLIIPKDHPQVAELRAAIDSVGQAKWGKSWPAVKRVSESKDLNCLHDGDLKAKYAGFEGNLYVSTRASEDKRPTVVDRNRSPLTAADGKIYGGCYVNAILVLWAQDNSYGQRVNAQLTGVQFFRDGDSFGGGAGAASVDDFADIADGATADDLA